jgi:hypothetical protein
MQISSFSSLIGSLELYKDLGVLPLDECLDNYFIA